MISVILLMILSVGEVDLKAVEDSGECNGEREEVLPEENEAENDSISACSSNASCAIEVSSGIASEAVIHAPDSRVQGLG
jgi:hypothetical protein